MADQAPLKFIDIKDMLSGLQDKSLAMSFLPGQGQIPPASPEFLAANPQYISNVPLPNMFSLESLAGTLGQMGDYGLRRPGNQAIQDRQQRGFFAQTLDDRLRGAGQ